MSQYMSIGKVAKLKNVSIKSLRYYDRIGILKPAFVNEETNYRYYTEKQLYLLDAITLCIKLGIPLKDLNNYVENDSINLQKLLYDGKILAEEKILEIHKCLEALQDTLQQLAASGSDNGLAKIPESKSGILLPDGFYSTPLNTRTVLTVPLEDLDTPKYYGQYILKLFVTAQQMGLAVSYPSGILHEYQNGTLTRYMFLTLDAGISPETAKAQAAGAGASSDAIRTLPAGDYICRKIAVHMSGSVQEEMKEVLKSDSFCIIETDTTSSENKKDGYPFELQYLIAP
ncbi:MAG: MerR family transcriptional regulator [Lachnospiraceae bacterium]|nr:MerR family transcriptional regulator [Lachnospiraceae bacterium]